MCLRRNTDRGAIMEKEKTNNNEACILKIAAVVYKPTKKRNVRPPKEEKEQVMPKISSGIGKKFLKKSTDQRTRNKLINLRVRGKGEEDEINLSHQKTLSRYGPRNGQQSLRFV